MNRRGIGITEAPRGTLIHDYTVSESGMIERCNLIVATCQNNYAIDRGVEDMARRVVENGALTEAANRIEMIIRGMTPASRARRTRSGGCPCELSLSEDE